MRAVILTVATLALTLQGCASITGTTGQSVSVMTREQNGQEISGVACDLSNNKGTWFVTTPGSAPIRRSNDDLQVICRKEGMEPGRAAVVSDTKGSMFGNILFGGGIGAIVDHSNGSAYEYPNLIQVVMGTFTKISPPKKEEPAKSNPLLGSSEASPVEIKVEDTEQKVVYSKPVEKKSDGNEVKLKELKRLYENGLITKEVYAEEQRKILETQ